MKCVGRVETVTDGKLASKDRPCGENSDYIKDGNSICEQCLNQDGRGWLLSMGEAIGRVEFINTKGTK